MNVQTLITKQVAIFLLILNVDFMASTSLKKAVRGNAVQYVEIKRHHKERGEIQKLIIFVLSVTLIYVWVNALSCIILDIGFERS